VSGAGHRTVWIGDWGFRLVANSETAVPFPYGVWFEVSRIHGKGRRRQCRFPTGFGLMFGLVVKVQVAPIVGTRHCRVPHRTPHRVGRGLVFSFGGEFGDGNAVSLRGLVWRNRVFIEI